MTRLFEFLDRKRFSIFDVLGGFVVVVMVEVLVVLAKIAGMS